MKSRLERITFGDGRTESCKMSERLLTYMMRMINGIYDVYI